MIVVPDTAIVIQFAIAVIVLAVTPGPDMTLFVGRALSEGQAAGLACFFGASTGILIHTIMVVVGLSALIVASPSAFLALKIVGAGYLIWLAVQAIRQGSAYSPTKKAGQGRTLMANWVKGVGINLMNPKIILFYMTFLPQFVSADDPQAPGKLMFLGLMSILVAFPVVLPMIIAADGFAALLSKSPRVTRVVDWLFAGVFSAFAVKILMTQTR